MASSSAVHAFDILQHVFAMSQWSHVLFTLLDLCVSCLRRGHANFLCIVPILMDDPRRESNNGRMDGTADA